ncbi:hypothetical protein SAMN05892883_0361 [Jatrophihabitans sp. GAS493]|uniref:hypothetical protein n=1 Tax=Jatrophihabitans sp. GAS493 TaxID=1907575 RepID=UPI000BC0A373|nr:hypothetical protein [Jatrophihabitans sp. GAS493]SOD70701.1 hypothetical protein SAMN05892883_0361 [Jatrophihabitans sp. GAS493]
MGLVRIPPRIALLGEKYVADTYARPALAGLFFLLPVAFMAGGGLGLIHLSSRQSTLPRALLVAAAVVVFLLVAGICIAYAAKASRISQEKTDRATRKIPVQVLLWPEDHRNKPMRAGVDETKAGRHRA